MSKTVQTAAAVAVAAAKQAAAARTEDAVNAVCLTVGGISIPAVADKPSVRKLAKALAGLAGESALASRKASPESDYAFALALVLFGAVDNNSSPLIRVTALVGDKPNKGQAAALHSWAQASAAGKAAFVASAVDVNLNALVNHETVSALSPAAVANAKAAAIAEQKRLASVAKITALRESAEKAAADKAIAEHKAALEKACVDAYRDARHHGEGMDNQAAAAAEQAAAAHAAKEAAAAAAQASKAAWLAEQAAKKAAIVTVDRAVAVAEFKQLAAALGVMLSAAQLSGLEKAAA